MPPWPYVGRIRNKPARLQFQADVIILASL